MSRNETTSDGLRRTAAAPTLQRSALEMCADVISAPPPAVADITSRDTLLTAPWTHPEMHEAMPGLPVHTIATYFGEATPRRWTVERKAMTGMARPGTATVIPAGWDGHWDIDVQSPVSYVFLGDARLQKSSEPFMRGRRVELVPRLAEPDVVGAHLMRILSHEAGNAAPSSRLFMEQTIELLCLHLLRTHAVLAPPALSRPHRGLANWQVRRVTAYMNEHLHRPIGLDELAGLFDLSRSHFCSAFRKATGETPHESLTRHRMQHAQAMLRDMDVPVSAIAAAVGYGTPSAFTAAFRRHTTVSPSEYRRSL